MKASVKCTVFFEDPFWAGIWEQMVDGTSYIAKTSFASEPSEQEIYTFLFQSYARLAFCEQFSTQEKKRMKNPKRQLREVRKELQHTGVGTKSQQALQLQKEAMIQRRKQQKAQSTKARKQELFAMKQTKKKQKAKGH